ncbi:protein of unknown function [Pseudomonas mediterranea]
MVLAFGVCHRASGRELHTQLSQLAGFFFERHLPNQSFDKDPLVSIRVVIAACEFKSDHDKQRTNQDGGNKMVHGVGPFVGYVRWALDTSSSRLMEARPCGIGKARFR